MKNFIIILSIILISPLVVSQEHKNSYESLWEKVEKLERDALTKSALKLVTEISKKAKEDNNAPQVIKALLFSAKYNLIVEENAQLKIINNFKKEIKKAKFPTKNILEGYLANLYWQYFQQNRYRFYNRTKASTKINATDFRTWDLNSLFKEISLHFEASLQNEADLKKILVSEFNDILTTQKNSKKYRPTLFDLLAHNALDFYKTSENNIIRPANKFEIDDPKFFKSGSDFITINIVTKDDTSLQAKALCIYQKLLLLHSSSKFPYSYAEINLERLNFIFENATFANKEQLFFEVLQEATIASKGSVVAGLYQHQIATLLNYQGEQYTPITNIKNQWKTKEALSICEKVIKELPDSRGAEQCKSLKSKILEKSLQLTIESHIPTNTTSRILVEYKNLNRLKLSAYRVTQHQLNRLDKLYQKNKKLSFIKELLVTKEWSSIIKDEFDYQPHSTEILIPALESGYYIILAEVKNKTNETFAYSKVQVTDIALIETRARTHHYFQVINRNNGKPIANATLNLSYRKNYGKSPLNKKFTSDEMGNIVINLGNDDYWNNVQISVSNAKETAYFKSYYIYPNNDQSSYTTNYSCFLFTDRSIYRPGQPIYFKGIAIKQENKISSILSNKKIHVALKNVNGQVVSTKEFTSNNYGSFSGQFILPNNGQTGMFSLQIVSNKGLYGYTPFSVEEYKRPKFETSFKPVTETYKVNDSITVNGTATAYAGSVISNAKVNYRIKRLVYYPRWCYWYYPNINTASQEIAHGETFTDASGTYTINFKALPDRSINKKNLPTFSYEVTADITDINGETHSTTTVVKVGYHTLTAKMQLANPFNKNTKDNKLTVSTKNLNDQFVPAKGTIKMYKLKAPKSVNRPRKWPAPDYVGWSKEEFKKLYPHDIYSNEDKAPNWEKGQLVWQTNFNTAIAKEFYLKNTKKWLSGKYVLELEAKDKFGQPVKDILETTLISNDDKKLADNELFQIKTNKESYSIGDIAKVTLLSNSEDINVTVTIEKNHKVIDTKLIHLNHNSESFSLPINADNLGGFAISYSFSAYNHFQSGTVSISVPYPNSDLEIETLTFRDKLQPAAEETWSFKIKGPKGDKVAAELLANMYDASLDTFKKHSWTFNPLIKPTYVSNRTFNPYQSYGINSFNTYIDNKDYNYNSLHFSSFNWFGFQFGYGGYGWNVRRSSRKMMTEGSAIPSPQMEMDNADNEPIESNVMVAFQKDETLSNIASNQQLVQPEPTNKSEQEGSSKTIKIRKNLQENAFFFPHLKTDKEGNVSFSFTTPEALTKWNVQLLSHTKNLESSIQNLQAITQKELMVLPNAPRFLREGDEIVISTKIANLTEKVLDGKATLELEDALTGKKVPKQLLISPNSSKGFSTENKSNSEINFKVDAMGNTQVSWKLKIPKGIQALQYTVTAKAGDYSDGEQNILPVLTNRMLVTETLPMWVGSNQKKTFTLDKLKTNTSTTLDHHKLTLEITSNPVWYAVQALPYLMEYPYECNEQTFSKYYANTIASYMVNSNTRIKKVFKQWANSDALVSNLEKNEELKSLLIQETPWLRDAQSETEQKKRIALLFNLNKMKNDQAAALRKLKQNQKKSGAWSWFYGGPDNRFITQYIITGLGHLKQLNIIQSYTKGENKTMIQSAINYLDNEFIAEYERMKKHTNNINNDHLSYIQIHYLYMRSFFKDIKASKKVSEITNYYKTQIQNYWKNKGLYAKGMLSLIMHRMDDKKTTNKILRALKENSITSKELGMYWKENTNSWNWYHAPIETQSLLIEAFSEITPSDIETIDNLKIWLLKHKQTNQWKTTKATSEAIYALLLQGSNWLSVTDAVDVLIGGKKIEPSILENVKVEAGMGYYKTAWRGTEVKPKMAEVQLNKKGEGIAWGALYWQYFENLDKITAAVTPLKLKKNIFLKKNTVTGEEISKITDNTHLKVGDLVRVRIELQVDRPIEFVHMKDMRAAGFEPINVISTYKWQDGLGYYESTKDACTNFFFDYLPKGVYVFEYDLRVNNTGNFSNGITTIQSMYAPEFSSHSKGIRVKVK